jgi:hypothetical protein
VRTHPASAVRGSRVAAGLQRAPGWVGPVEVRGDVHRRRGPHGALRVDSIAERHRVAVGGRSGAFAVLVARDGEAHRALDGLRPSGRASDVHRVSSSAPDWSGDALGSRRTLRVLFRYHAKQRINSGQLRRRRHTTHTSRMSAHAVSLPTQLAPARAVARGGKRAKTRARASTVRPSPAR